MAELIRLRLSIIRSHYTIWMYTLDMAMHVGIKDALAIRRRVFDNVKRREEWERANG